MNEFISNLSDQTSYQVNTKWKRISQILSEYMVHKIPSYKNFTQDKREYDKTNMFFPESP
jgi:hypothetical protein